MVILTHIYHFQNSENLIPKIKKKVIILEGDLSVYIKKRVSDSRPDYRKVATTNIVGIKIFTQICDRQLLSPDFPERKILRKLFRFLHSRDLSKFYIAILKKENELKF